MASSKTQRLATAIGFLSGVIACLDALRDMNVDWPPIGLWQALSVPRRLELGAGVALIVVTLIATAFRNRSA